MSAAVDQREDIVTALSQFASHPLPEAAIGLFATLGYGSDRRLRISTAKQFRAQLDPENKLTEREAEALDKLTSLHLLFQLTGTELEAHRDLLDDATSVQSTKIDSYLFFAAELPAGQYTRSALSALVRALNKPLPMPALILLRYGDLVSIGIIHRRLDKRDASKDVLEKVTLIKDIAFADPIRAHIEILNDFVLANLDADFGTSNFVSLHNAWQKRLGSYALSNDFYREIADWYFWAHHQVKDGTICLPKHCDTEEEQSLFLIRLLTRLIFCWFLVEKRLLPSEFFGQKHLRALLKDLTKDAPTYYRAVLQNLFFGTLNMPAEQRGFREKKKEGQRYDKNRGITNLWRYGTLFQDYDKAKDESPAWVTLAKKVPFLNGGLFDCLDDKTGKKLDNFILDGFSDNPNESCHLPNDLFFGAERNVDLSEDYGEEDKRTARSKRAKVRGLIEILARYKFTIEENTPLEEEIALDPELLGKVFENLLASYNEDTRTTARKALGAFYTPREIVSYMVDEALRSYLATQIPAVSEKALRDLFSAKDTPPEIKAGQREALVTGIGRVKILDPACGSGAFLMGALHRLVDLLQKLDPNNQSWKRDRLGEARRYRDLLEEAGADKDEIADYDSRIVDIEKSFNTRFHALDFARKLYLIENCIYGVDVQPIATQIAKLRFFISLIVDQKVDAAAPNLGVRPLPNLETRLVAADALIPIEKQSDRVSGDLFAGDIDRLRADLAHIRHEHFNSRDPRKKAKWRAADAAKRTELANLLKKEHGLPKDSATKLATWDPYDQNEHAPFFDAEWMFGLPLGKVRLDGKSPVTLRGNLALINEAGGQTELVPKQVREIDSGFDILILNPPYRKERDSKALFDKIALTEWGARYKEGKMDMWFYFMHRAIDLVRRGGTIVFITSRYWIESSGAKKLIRRIASDLTPIDIVDIGKLRVFENVAGHHMVHSYTRGDSERKITVKRLIDDLSGLNATKTGPTVEVFTRNSAELFAEDGRIRLYATQIDLSQNPRLGDFYLVSQGVVQNPDKVNRKNAERFDLSPGAGVFVLSPSKLSTLNLSSTEQEFVKPFYDESDIRRFYLKSASASLIYLTKKNCNSLSKLPHIRNHLEQFRQIMEERRETKNGTIEWFHLHWPRNPNFFEGSHLLFPSMFTRPTAAAMEIPAYVGIGCNVVIPNSNKANVAVLACFLNSNLSAFWWTENAKQRGAGFDVGVDRLRNFPLPLAHAAETSNQTLAALGIVIGYVSQCLEGEMPDRNSRDPLMLAYFEQILNGLVYELYFPDEVHGAGLRVFDLLEAANLPLLDVISETQRLPRLRQLFETLHDGAHPLKIDRPAKAANARYGPYHRSQGVKITKVSLQGFRAFDELFEFDLANGKNLLLHGENGSGKSSLYFALKRFFEERGDDIAKHRNHFCPDTRDSYVRIHLRGKDAAGTEHDQDFRWDVPDGHPLPVPRDPAIASISAPVRSMLVDGARRAGFLDYRSMLRTHLLFAPLSRLNRGPSIHNAIYGAEAKGLEAQLFDLVSLVVLAGVRVAGTGGKETTLGELIRRVWENRPYARYKGALGNANYHATAFTNAFNAKLPEVEIKLASFLSYFENNELSIKFHPVALTWDKPSLELKGAELIPEIIFRGKEISNHHQFLNEGRLSALAVCMFLAGVVLCDNDYDNPAYSRLLVLDDALVGLDLQNRLPILKILSSGAFKNYQILLFTYDRVWFDLARGHLQEQDGWLHRELIADEDTGYLIPRSKPCKNDLETAKVHLGNGDLKAAAVYARSALEWKLRNICENHGIKIPFKPENDKIGAGILWDGIIQRQREREDQRAQGAQIPDFVPEALARDVATMRSTVLNKLSHTGASELVRDEVGSAIRTVERVHQHNFPKVKNH